MREKKPKKGKKADSVRKPDRKTSSVRIGVTPDELDQIDALAGRLNSSRAAVLRQGLPALVRELESLAAGGMLEQVMAGDAATKAWKEKFLAALEQGKGVTSSARLAGVTRGTVYYHLEADPVFRERSNEAKDFSVETVEDCLIEQAKKGSFSAQIAFLNAKHPDYGFVRTQQLLRVLNPFLDRIVELASRYIRPEDLKRFVEELSRDAESVLVEAAARGRR